MTKVFVGGSRRINRLNDKVRARLDEIFGTALKEPHVRQHGQAGRAMRRIARGNFRGTEILAQHTLAGTGLLDLGDHGGSARPDLVTYRGREIADVGRIVGLRAHLRQGNFRFRGSDFLRFDGKDFFQYVGHAGFEKSNEMHRPLSPATRTGHLPPRTRRMPLNHDWRIVMTPVFP